ncbi:Ammonium Transporter Family [Branchiostoma belcheri]|nr:Ammonium Transporter Family [Branchiostoma belcheri]
MDVFAKFIFQLSFATTSTTIVSGAMAERTKLNSYIVFSMLNTVVYIFPAHWVWAPNGFLYTMGVIDVAGTGAVHLCGASCGLVATLLLKPRVGRFDDEKGGGSPEMSSPTNVLLGTFMLWWGWLGFNCGSTYGIQGGKWKLAARSAVSTMLGSLGGGLVGVTYSYATKKGQFNVGDIVNGILGGLVSVTAICAIASPFGGLVIGSFGGLVADLGVPLLNYLKIDDPVGAVPVHGFAAIWGMLAVGLFALNDGLENFSFGRKGTYGQHVSKDPVTLLRIAIAYQLRTDISAVRTVQYSYRARPMYCVFITYDLRNSVRSVVLGMLKTTLRTEPCYACAVCMPAYRKLTENDRDSLDESVGSKVGCGRLVFGKGLLYGGGPYLLGVQLIAVVVIILWGAGISFVLLKLIDLTMGLRMSEEEEELGADICEHEIDQETDPYEEIQRYLTICDEQENKMAAPENKMAADAEDDGKGTGHEMAAAGETRGMFAIARALFQEDKTDRPYTPNGIADGGTNSYDPINFDKNWILRRAMKEH